MVVDQLSNKNAARPRLMFIIVAALMQKKANFTLPANLKTKTDNPSTSLLQGFVLQPFHLLPVGQNENLVIACRRFARRYLIIISSLLNCLFSFCNTIKYMPVDKSEVSIIMFLLLMFEILFLICPVWL